MRVSIVIRIASLYILACGAGAQTQIDLASQSRDLILTRSGTILFRSASTMPATCSAGEALINNNAPPGQNLYICVTPNSWVLQGDNQTFAVNSAPGEVPVAGSNGKIGQSWIDYTGYQTALGFTPLSPANNLSELSNPATARTSLGLGSAATKGVQGTGGTLAAFEGGITFARDCVIFDSSGNLADSGAPCGGGTGGAGAANYKQAFTAQTTVTLAHNANSAAVLIQCFDSGNNLLIPNFITLTNLNTATVSFSSPQSGTCVVNSSGGGPAGASSFSQMSGVAAIAQGGTGQITQQAAFDGLSPNTTKGDVAVYNGLTNTRVGVGADGSCWIADSTQPAGVRWGSCSGSHFGAGCGPGGQHRLGGCDSGSDLSYRRRQPGLPRHRQWRLQRANVLVDRGIDGRRDCGRLALHAGSGVNRHDAGELSQHDRSPDLRPERKCDYAGRGTDVPGHDREELLKWQRKFFWLWPCLLSLESCSTAQS